MHSRRRICLSVHIADVEPIDNRDVGPLDVVNRPMPFTAHEYTACTYGLAACPLSRRNGSPRCILLPWCTGIRPKPYAGDSTGDRSSGGYAKIGCASGVYILRNGHICLACIALIRNVTFPLSVNDNNNVLSVIGSYWSDRRFRALHSGMYALLKLLS